MARSQIKTPSLQRHVRGQYFIKFGGEQHYLGTDLKEAEKLYAAKLVEWAAWREQQKERRERVSSKLTFAELVELFEKSRFPDVSADMHRYYKNHLRRAVNVFGRMPAAMVTGKYLATYLVDLRQVVSDRTDAPLGPKTVKHEIAAIKAVLNWAMDVELVPEIRLSGVKPPRAAPKRKKALTLEFIKGIVARARAEDPNLECWIAVHYLAGCRPSELPRLAARDGEMVHQAADGAIFDIVGKSTWKTGEMRHVYLSPEALVYFNAMKPQWKTWRAYARRVSALSPGGAHPLRHSAYAHLRAMGVAEEEIAQFVGHARTDVARSYDPTARATLLRSAARLTLR